jgi:signal transduction histidine kinase/AmiR/NasT family two-component response regulator
MFAAVYCIAHQHSPWLVALAAAVSVVTMATALRLLKMASRADPPQRWALLMFGGACGGAGAWATHFIAMLSYDPGLATGYAPGGTVASLIVAVVGASASLFAAIGVPGPWNRIAWGGLFGLWVGAMHYTGMAAFRVPGALSWDLHYVALSIVAGAVLATIGLVLLERTHRMRGFLAASACVALSILVLHFVGMAGMSVLPDPTVATPHSLLPNYVVALAVSGLTSLLILGAIAAIWVETRMHGASLTLLRSVIDAMPQALAYFDPNDRYALGNDAYNRMLARVGLQPATGLTYREILQAAAAAHFNRGSLEERSAWVDERMTARAGVESSFTEHMADGRHLQVHTSRTSVGGVVTVVSDITDLTRQADDLAAARDLSEAATRAKSTFLATMSHEIRTPLNGVLGMAHAMAADELSPAQHERLGIISRSGEGLLAILNDVLDLSKIEAGKFELEMIPFDLAEVVGGAHSAFTALAHEKGLAFDLEIDPTAHGVYRGDPTRIRQVLYNLISNGLKFTEAGSVRVAVERAGGDLRVMVADTGIGMSPEQASGLFQKFVQADASTTRRYGGTGLGLAISRELVELMGGTIRVDSAPGRGTVVRIAWPAARIADSEALPAPAPTPTCDTTELPPLQVLAAEDNPINQLVLKALLAQVGIEPTMVEDGAKAVAAWADKPWDLILMDVQMPVMDGPSATQEIRRQERLTARVRTPIIAVTANAMAHQIEEYLAAGMDRHVAKPIEASRLFAAIEAALEEAPDAPPLQAKA